MFTSVSHRLSARPLQHGAMVLSLSYVLAGCAPEEAQAEHEEDQAQQSAAGETEPELSSHESALTVSGPYTEAEWFKGEPYKELIPQTQGFCYLAGIQGNFDAGDDQAGVFISGNGKYGLYGGNSEWAKAVCVNWSALKINYNAFEPVRWLSDELYAISSCNSKYADSWHGDALTYLTGVGGDLAGGGGSFIIQSSEGGKPSQLLSTHTCGNGKEVFTRGRSMFFGKPHSNDMPQFWGPKAQGKTFSLAGYYHAQSNTQDGVEMAPVDKAFCVLQGVNGNYNQTGDWAWLYVSTNSAGKKVWKLQVNDAGQTSGKFTGATAACYMLSQN